MTRSASVNESKIRSVTCAFHDSYRGYDYLTDIDLKVGDKVVVASEYAPPENFGYAIVEVTVLNEPVNLNEPVSFEWKWVLAKISDRKSKEEEEWL